MERELSKVSKIVDHVKSQGIERVDRAMVADGDYVEKMVRVTGLTRPTGEALRPHEYRPIPASHSSSLPARTDFLSNSAHYRDEVRTRVPCPRDRPEANGANNPPVHLVLRLERSQNARVVFSP